MLSGKAGDSSALESEENSSGNIKRVSTRAWAKQHEYDPEKLFGKFFFDDINYLLSMDKLWAKRKPPTPLCWDSHSVSNPQTGNLLGLLRYCQTTLFINSFILRQSQ